MAKFTESYRRMLEAKDEVSAGVLLASPDRKRVFLTHPGGPFFAGKQGGGFWSIPKGHVEAGESSEDAARREFEEETGLECPAELEPLGSVRMKSGKTVHGFLAIGTGNEKFVGSNEFEMEWPKGSGNVQKFPENEDGRWFDTGEAAKIMNTAQAEFLTRI